MTMDFGALYDGYHADMTRTVAIGSVAGWQRDIYDLVALAQRGRHRGARGRRGGRARSTPRRAT